MSNEFEISDGIIIATLMLLSVAIGKYALKLPTNLAVAVPVNGFLLGAMKGSVEEQHRMIATVAAPLPLYVVNRFLLRIPHMMALIVSVGYPAFTLGGQFYDFLWSMKK